MTILHCLDHGANLHESSWHMVSSAQDGLQAILLQLVCDVPANRNEATSATFAVASIFELCRSLAKRLEILRLLAAVWVQWGYLDHQNSFATATERRSIARLPPNTEWYRRLQHLQLHFGEFWSLPSIISLYHQSVDGESMWILSMINRQLQVAFDILPLAAGPSGCQGRCQSWSHPAKWEQQTTRYQNLRQSKGWFHFFLYLKTLCTWLNTCTFDLELKETPFSAPIRRSTIHWLSQCVKPVQIHYHEYCCTSQMLISAQGIGFVLIVCGLLRCVTSNQVQTGKQGGHSSLARQNRSNLQIFHEISLCSESVTL